MKVEPKFPRTFIELCAHRANIAFTKGTPYPNEFRGIRDDSRENESTVWVFHPNALRAQLLVQDKELIEMIRASTLAAPGVFEAVTRFVIGDSAYRFRLTLENGREVDFEDAYRERPQVSFPRVVTLKEANHDLVYKNFGARKMTDRFGREGVCFTVWAPNENIQSISVIGDFNDWTPLVHPMFKMEDGIWRVFIPGISDGHLYKYQFRLENGDTFDKSDPFTLSYELRPGTAAKTFTSQYQWGDDEYMAQRKANPKVQEPILIYEVHLPSFKRENGQLLNYRKLAHEILNHVKEMGYTHVQLMPITEYPADESWGYQCVGYFAPTSRHGNPDDFKYMVDLFHRNNIGVILDFVPGHFCDNNEFLDGFDGSNLFCENDNVMRRIDCFGAYAFDFRKEEVRNFLLASAQLWIEEYHVDGLRVDAVTPMLELDFGREGKDWHGRNLNMHALAFLQSLNKKLEDDYPWVISIAEEARNFRNLTRPVRSNGVGFHSRWDMEWEGRIIDFFNLSPYDRCFKIEALAKLFSREGYDAVLPLSHDTVNPSVNPNFRKGSLIKYSPYLLNEDARFHNLRLLISFLYAYPGNKHLFMGMDFGHSKDWNSNGELDWSEINDPRHSGVSKMVRDLNGLVKRHKPLHEKFYALYKTNLLQCSKGQLTFARYDFNDNPIVVTGDFSSIISGLQSTQVQVPRLGRYREIFNSDRKEYGGQGRTNTEILTAEEDGWGRIYIRACVPSLSLLMFESVNN